MTRKNRSLPSDCIEFFFAVQLQVFVVIVFNLKAVTLYCLTQLIVLSLHSYIDLYILSPTIPIWS